jgi:hypothetical protein
MRPARSESSLRSGGRSFVERRSLDLTRLEDLEHVPFLHVIEALEEDAALEALGDFPDVVDPTVPPTVPPTLTNLTGGTAPFAPEFSLNIGASYDFAVSNGMSITPRVDVSHVSDQNGAVFESPRTLIPERTLINAELGNTL